MALSTHSSTISMAHRAYSTFCETIVELVLKPVHDCVRLGGHGGAILPLFSKSLMSLIVIRVGVQVGGGRAPGGVVGK